MPEIVEKNQSQKDQCWVDFYESDYFSGKLRRVRGPRKVRQFNAKSVIVGPGTAVMLSIRRRGKDSVIKLDSKRVVPNLRKLVQGAIIGAAAVCVE